PTLLPDDPRRDDGKFKDYFEYQKRMLLLAGKPVTFLVERGPEDNKQRIAITVAAAYHRTLGVRMKMDQITAVREGSAAADPVKGVKKPRTFTDQSTTLEGDVIEAVEVKDAAGNVIQRKKGENL